MSLRRFPVAIAARVGARMARPWFGGIGSVVVLHRVLPAVRRSYLPESRALEITPEDLDAVLAEVRRLKLEPVAMDEVPGRLSSPRGTKFIAFTLDDGYRDNLEFALPVFQKWQVPFTVNVATGLVDGSEPAWWYALDRLAGQGGELRIEIAGAGHLFPLGTKAERNTALEQAALAVRATPIEARDAVLEALLRPAGIDALALTREMMMTPDEVRALAADPLVTIGAHTRRHPSLANLSAVEAQAEMAESRQLLEGWTGQPVTHFAYPFGGQSSAGEREYALARECGFATAVTTRMGNLQPCHAGLLQALPRLTLSGNFPAVKRFRMLESGLVTARSCSWRRSAAP